MNAAFLLVTSAWLAGADPAPPPSTATAPATASSVPSTISSGGCSSCGGGYVGSSCGCNSCDSCNSCCEEREGFFSRLRAKFSRNRCCEDTCSSCSSCGSSCSSCGSSCSSCNSCNTTHYSCECEDSCTRKCGGGWLKGLFSRHKDCGCESSCGCESGCNSCGSGCSSCGNGGTIISNPAGTQPNKMPPAGEKIPAPKDGAPANQLPKGTTAVPSIDVTPTSSKQIEETKNPFELDRRYETRVDRATDYSWLTGQLFYVHADGGLWVLRYAPIGKEEVNGGSVVLARDVVMDSYREGDLVKVHGDIVQQKASASLGGPLYRIQTIQLVDRPGQ